MEVLRSSGRGTARDRIETLLDEGSFVEIDALVAHRITDHGMHQHRIPGDGVVCGYGTIDGRRVHCFSQDFTVHGGAVGEMHVAKIAKIVDMADRSRTPLVCIWDGGGTRHTMASLLSQAWARSSTDWWMFWAHPHHLTGPRSRGRRLRPRGDVVGFHHLGL